MQAKRSDEVADEEEKRADKAEAERDAERARADVAEKDNRLHRGRVNFLASKTADYTGRTVPHEIAWADRQIQQEETEYAAGGSTSPKEDIAALRAAGGDGWDDIDDPEEFLYGPKDAAGGST